jgi:hypothetical protein
VAYIAFLNLAICRTAIIRPTILVVALFSSNYHSIAAECSTEVSLCVAGGIATAYKSSFCLTRLVTSITSLCVTIIAVFNTCNYTITTNGFALILHRRSIDKAWAAFEARLNSTIWSTAIVCKRISIIASFWHFPTFQAKAITADGQAKTSCACTSEGVSQVLT